MALFSFLQLNTLLAHMVQVGLWALATASTGAPCVTTRRRPRFGAVAICVWGGSTDVA